MIKDIPTYNKDPEIGTVGFYEFFRMVDCPFGGIDQKKLLLSGELLESPPTKQLIVGRIFHEIMEKAPTFLNQAELLSAMNEIANRYQVEYFSYISRRKLGNIISWSEVGRTFEAASKIVSGERKSKKKETTVLYSRNRKFKGIPDKYSTISELAFLTEYKSSSIYGEGTVKEEYMEQVKFYAHLLSDNYPEVNKVAYSLVSLTGEKYSGELSKKEISEHSQYLSALYDTLEERGIEQAPSADTCRYCIKKPICSSYKAEIAESEGDVIEGTVSTARKSDGVWKVKIDEKFIEAKNDFEEFECLDEGKRYTFCGLKKNRDKHIYTTESGIYGQPQ